MRTQKKDLPSYVKIEEIFNSLDSLLVELDREYKPTWIELFASIHLLQLKLLTFYTRDMLRTEMNRNSRYRIKGSRTIRKCHNGNGNSEEVRVREVEVEGNDNACNYTNDDSSNDTYHNYIM